MDPLVCCSLVLLSCGLAQAQEFEGVWKPETKSTPVKREGGQLEFKLPFDPPSVVIEGDKMTATAGSIPGGGGAGFIDYWERVR